MIGFFNVTLPIQLVFQVHNIWWLVLLAPTILILLRYVLTTGLRQPIPRCSVVEQLTPPTWPCCPVFKPSIICLFLVVSFHLLIPFLLQWAERVGCAPCQGRLPKKPGLIAHRGCGFVYPENTILSFMHSSQIPGMIGLETDVQVYMPYQIFCRSPKSFGRL